MKLITISLLVLIVTAFSAYVWPTRYLYDHFHSANGMIRPVRIDRFTGQADMLDYGGWDAMKP